MTGPKVASVEAGGRPFTLRLYEDEWICSATLGSVEVDEISVLDASGLPPWAAAGLNSLMESFPEKVATAQGRLEVHARQLFTDGCPVVLAFDLIGARLLDAERHQVEFVMSPQVGPWFDTYGLWVATFRGGTLIDVRREQN